MAFQVRQNGWSLEMYHYNNVVSIFDRYFVQVGMNWSVIK